jgi:hypothetical protein
MATAVGAKDALALAVQASGVADRLEAEGGLEAEGRLENLAELVNAAATFETLARRNGEAGDIEAFLESAALLGSADDAPRDDGRGQITLMTLHAAKGLEFGVVFLIGLEEHGFPHSRAVLDDDESAIEEERRLAYVGITRARRRLVLSWAARRMVQGVVKPRDPSRFLFEIPREVLEGDVPRRGGDGERASLLAQWRARQAGAGRGWSDRRGDGDDDDGSARVVYDPDVVDIAPAARPPREPRTRLGMTDPGDDDRRRGAVVHDAAFADARAGSDDAPSATRTTVVRDDDDAPRVGGFGRPARRFALGAPGGTATATTTTSTTTMSTTTATSTTTTTTVDRGDDEGADGFASGDRVFHRLFGDGTIVGRRGAGRALNCLVRFDSERAPRLIAARHLKPADAAGDPA